MSNIKCSICGAPATICVKETINGVTSEKYYCENCKGLIDNGAGLESLINNFFGMGRRSARSGAKTCVCGTTEREVIENGKFGCAECYKTFSNIVGEYLNSRGYSNHQGKTPKCSSYAEVKSKVNPINETERLKAELQTAINEQRFLDADKLANKIRVLEQKGGQ